MGKQMNVGIIGVGKLGLVYALMFEKRGLNVYASSYKQEYVEKLHARCTDTVEPMVADLLHNAKNIFFTTDNHEVIENCDLVYVMVATPSTDKGDYNVDALQQVIDDFKNHSNSVDGKICIVGCTVNPGDCANMQEQVTHLGVEVVYCPTFAAQGTVVRDIQNPLGILFGTTNTQVADRCKRLFESITPKDIHMVHVHSTTAEILKMAMNCYSTMRISFYNQIGQLMIKSGRQEDLENVNRYFNLVDTKKTGLKFGFGFGGPCFPRDNRALSVYAEKIAHPYEFGSMIDKFNQSHVEFLGRWLLQNNLENLVFYFDHLSYKPGVNLFEESHQLKVCEYLLVHGAKVCVKDTEFLDHDLISSIIDRFGDQISLDTDSDQQQMFYHVKF